MYVRARVGERVCACGRVVRACVNLVQILNDGIPVDDAIARSGVGQACEHGHGGRLPGPVVAKKAGDLALEQVEPQAVHGGPALPGPLFH